MKNHISKKKNKTKKQKQPFNMFEWGQKYKKTFAGVICLFLVITMILGILQF